MSENNSESTTYISKYKDIDFRKHPELYDIGKGEQGVLTAEPYKSEILPYWKFADPGKAVKSADTILKIFYGYKRAGDFVGMDMARKFLQMGYTRARRYANYESGKKYDGPIPKNKKGQSGSHGRKMLPRGKGSYIKSVSASIFYERYIKAKNDRVYLKLKEAHKLHLFEVTSASTDKKHARGSG